MGQTFESHSTNSNAFSLRAKGRKEKDFLIGMTIDTMALSIAAPQGDMSPDLTPLRGQSFDMVLSPLGSEVDVSGVYVKSTSDMKMDVSITLSALGQTLPTTQTRKGEVKLAGMK